MLERKGFVIIFKFSLRFKRFKIVLYQMAQKSMNIQAVPVKEPLIQKFLLSVYGIDEILICML